MNHNTTIDAGEDCRGYRFFGYRDPKGNVRVEAGCRNFTLREAYAHWQQAHRDNRELRAECIGKVYLIRRVARARGWITASDAVRIDRTPSPEAWVRNRGSAKSWLDKGVRMHEEAEEEALVAARTRVWFECGWRACGPARACAKHQGVEYATMSITPRESAALRLHEQQERQRREAPPQVAQAIQEHQQERQRREAHEALINTLKAAKREALSVVDLTGKPDSFVGHMGRVLEALERRLECK